MATPLASVRGEAAKLPGVVVVGPLPPPYHGGAVATSFVLRSQLVNACRIMHLDTSDGRGLDNIGRFDAGNVLLAMRHVAALLRLILMQRPTAVYVPLAQNRLGLLRDAALVLPSLMARCRVVLHIHGSGLRDFYDSADPLLRWLTRLMLGRADRVIVLGESLRPMVEGLVEPRRVAVLPNGTDDVFGVASDDASGDPSGDASRRRRSGEPVRVLFLGNLRRAKGYLDAVRAIVMLREEGYAVELDLAGGFSSEADRVEGVHAITPVARAVRLHGVVVGAAKRELLAAADIFVFPSYSEGHPYVVLEAMSAGLPVVSSALPALAETVVDGETGMLVAPGDTGALARAIAALASDPEKRNRFGRAGRQRYEERYSYDVWSRGLRGIMAEVLS
ncbi:glycosyltransferase family 4 protein [soil metagenome]